VAWDVGAGLIWEVEEEARAEARTWDAFGNEGGGPTVGEEPVTQPITRRKASILCWRYVELACAKELTRARLRKEAEERVEDNSRRNRRGSAGKD
jgi:hypothetical protein